jgi:hypothetical protein
LRKEVLLRGTQRAVKRWKRERKRMVPEWVVIKRQKQKEIREQKRNREKRKRKRCKEYVKYIKWRIWGWIEDKNEGKGGKKEERRKWWKSNPYGILRKRIGFEEERMEDKKRRNKEGRKGKKNIHEGRRERMKEGRGWEMNEEIKMVENNREMSLKLRNKEEKERFCWGERERSKLKKERRERKEEKMDGGEGEKKGKENNDRQEIRRKRKEQKIGDGKVFKIRRHEGKDTQSLLIVQPRVLFTFKKKQHNETMDGGNKRIRRERQEGDVVMNEPVMDKDEEVYFVTMKDEAMARLAMQKAQEAEPEDLIKSMREGKESKKEGNREIEGEIEREKKIKREKEGRKEQINKSFYIESDMGQALLENMRIRREMAVAVKKYPHLTPTKNDKKW